MKYGFQSLMIGTVLLGNAVWRGGPFWVLLWPGVSLLLVAAGYFGLGPRIFGKRPDGTMPRQSVAVLLPYLLLTWGTWYLLRLLSREDCYNELVPGLFVGRRPLASDLPKDVAVVVDLTAEFSEHRSVRSGRRYISFPILDGGTADVEMFSALVDQIAESKDVTYIHCAQGHGRAGMLAAAILVRKGMCMTFEDAAKALRAIRPLAELNRRQLDIVRRAVVSHHDSQVPNPQPS